LTAEDRFLAGGQNHTPRSLPRRCQPPRRPNVVGQRPGASRASLYNDNVQLYREGIQMKKLLSILIAAMFAAVSYQAIAADEKSETPKMEKKAKTKKVAKKKTSKKVAKKEMKKEEMKK
jgi:hypothetical protein